MLESERFSGRIAVGDSKSIAKVSMKISKSKFCAGVQCLKRLYLLVREPELAAELDAASEAVIEQSDQWRPRCD